MLIWKHIGFPALSWFAVLDSGVILGVAGVTTRVPCALPCGNRMTCWLRSCDGIGRRWHHGWFTRSRPLLKLYQFIPTITTVGRGLSLSSLPSCSIAYHLNSFFLKRRFSRGSLRNHSVGFEPASLEFKTAILCCCPGLGKAGVLRQQR